MRAYLLTTGAVFALLAIVHLWRIIAESMQPARDPFFVGVTVIAAAMSVWAFRLLRSAPRA